MYKSKIVISVVSVLFLVLLVSGCGVPQEQYDEVLAQLEQANTQLFSANQSHVVVSASLADISANFTALSERLAELQEKLADAEKTNAELSASYNEAKVSVAVQNKLVVSANEENTELKDRIIYLEYNTFETDSGFFTMDYPEDWKTSVDFQSNDAGMIYFLESMYSETACILIFGPGGSTGGLNDLFDSFITGMRSSSDSIFIVFESETLIAGRDAIEAIVVVTEQDIDSAGVHIVCIDGDGINYLLVFTSSWSNFMAYSQTFNEMLESITIN